MELYIVRHAIAEEREQFLLKSLDDSLRPLTLEGQRKFKKIAKRLNALMGPIDVIVTSPYLRAQQTAELLQKFYPKVKLLNSEALVPTANPEDFVKWCHGNLLKKMNRILVVGHEPNLSILASWLLFGEKDSRIRLKKGGALALSLGDALKPSGAVLHWLVGPKVLAGE